MQAIRARATPGFKVYGKGFFLGGFCGFRAFGASGALGVSRRFGGFRSLGVLGGLGDLRCVGILGIVWGV